MNVVVVLLKSPAGLMIIDIDKYELPALASLGGLSTTTTVRVDAVVVASSSSSCLFS
jgi:hypothetical protein